MKLSLLLPLFTLTSTLAEKHYSCDQCKPSASVDQCLVQYTKVHKGRTSWRFKCSNIDDDEPCVSGKVIVANSTSEVETKYTETCSLKSSDGIVVSTDLSSVDEYYNPKPKDLTCAAKCPPMKDYCFEIKTEKMSDGRTKWTWACAPATDCKEGVTVSDGEHVEIAMCRQSDVEIEDSESEDKGDDPEAKVESYDSSEELKADDSSEELMADDSSDASAVSYSVASLLILVAGQYLL